MGGDDALDVFSYQVPQGEKGLRAIVQDTIMVIPLAHLVDVSAEKKRLNDQIKEGESVIAELRERLGQSDFRSKAPEEVIISLEERLAEAMKKKQALQETMMALKE